jgi:hypothetical protein
MNFEEMIQKWVKYDYCTPGIKSEVIIDMLISEFIEEIICFGPKIQEDTKKEDTKKEDTKKEDIELITKEFPFACNQDENRTNNRNFKADYLVADHKNKFMYVVELKTSKDSLSDEQFQNYTVKLNPNNFEKYWEFQEKLIATYKYNDKKHRAATEVYGSKKYSFTECELEKTRYKKDLNKKDPNKKDPNEKDSNEKDSNEQKYTMKLQYILLDKGWDRGWENVKGSNNWINNPIVLRDLCENAEFDALLSKDKKSLWEAVKRILKLLWEVPS